MAGRKSFTAKAEIVSIPKKSRQGLGKHTHYGATSRNGRKKKYRGQGR